MRILITGANGFIGKNLTSVLKQNSNHEIFECDIDTDDQTLEMYCEKSEFVFHLAGVNRPTNIDDFIKGNFGFTETLISKLRKFNNYCPIMLSSSIQANIDNPYGKSKLMGENTLIQYSIETGAPVLIYRFKNVFGKWSRPNYNSVVATFCYNLANGIEIEVHNPETEIDLIYIDDIVKEMISVTNKRDLKTGYYQVTPSYKTSLGYLADLLRSFNGFRSNLSLPNLNIELEKKLYSTFLSYLPIGEFKYSLRMNTDARGSFTEIFRTLDKGQISVNVSNPGVTKGNHWHVSKVEKFIVISGNGVIRFRKIGTDEIIEYYVSGNSFEVVDIPPGYTHNIENVGNCEMVTIMWANEPFDKDNPDTYFENV